MASLRVNPDRRYAWYVLGGPQGPRGLQGAPRRCIECYFHTAHQVTEGAGITCSAHSERDRMSGKKTDFILTGAASMPRCTATLGGEVPTIGRCQSGAPVNFRNLFL